jgi:hypothetical protein
MPHTKELKMTNGLYAPCGLYCGVCGVYMASRDNNKKLEVKFVKAYNVKSEQIACKGCLSDERVCFLSSMWCPSMC